LYLDRFRLWTQRDPAVRRSLLDQGLARIDPLRIGLEVAPDCAIVDCNGSPSRRLFTIGPLTRAAFWEIIATPDIRNGTNTAPPTIAISLVLLPAQAVFPAASHRHLQSGRNRPPPVPPQPLRLASSWQSARPRP
jgi:uncharacterized NAD(P)/FAD-binding protein YdhS